MNRISIFPKNVTSCVLTVLMIACFAAGGYGFFQTAFVPMALASVPQPTAGLRLITRDIKECGIGMRALGKNPLRDEVETAPEPDPATSRKLILRMQKASGHSLTVTLLRPLAWIESVGAEEGGSFHLDLPEMGAVGTAIVEGILPCPDIEKGLGNVITGTFVHVADPNQRILTVTFSNGAYINGITDKHPVYSVDRREFVPVGEMRQGEFVKLNDGIARITGVESRFPKPGEMLYNLETQNEHVYLVSAVGLLVHNNCITGSIQGMTPNKVAQDILGREPTWKKLGSVLKVIPAVWRGTCGCRRHESFRGS